MSLVIKYVGVSEWLMELVLKTRGRDERPVGSNPTTYALREGGVSEALLSGTFFFIC